MYLLPAPKPQLLLPEFAKSRLWGNPHCPNKGPGLWVQLSPKSQEIANRMWREHMAKSPEQRMREYAEAILSGWKLFSEVITSMIQDANVEATNRILAESCGPDPQPPK